MQQSRWNFDNMPDQLKQIPQWTCWKYQQRGKKTTKPPVNAKCQSISVQKPENWMTFEDAVQAYERNPRIEGIGFILTADLGLVGIDLDNCIDAEGNIEAWAADIVRRVNSYTEISPSGAGIRIFAYGTLPEGVEGRKKGKVEMYRAGRYLTLTGNRLELEGCEQ